MATTVGEVRESLLAEKWQDTLRLATAALAERKWEPGDEAFLHYARSFSLNNLDQFSEAQPSGQRAVQLAEEAEAWDLLGLALLNLAFIQAKMPKGAVMAVSTTRRYLDLVPRYRDVAKSKYLTAMRNLGYYLHAAGDDEAALEQFLAAKDAALKRRNADEVDTCRRNAVGVAFALRKLDLVADLIKQGSDYVAQHKADIEIAADHLIDMATLHELKGERRKALGRAAEALVKAEGHASLQARAVMIMHRIAKTQHMPKSALATGAVAKLLADQVERYDLIGELSVSLQEIGLLYRDTVRDFVDDATEDSKDDEDGKAPTDDDDE